MEVMRDGSRFHDLLSLLTVEKKPKLNLQVDS